MKRRAQGVEEEMDDEDADERDGRRRRVRPKPERHERRRANPHRRRQRKEDEQRHGLRPHEQPSQAADLALRMQFHQARRDGRLEIADDHREEAADLHRHAPRRIGERPRPGIQRGLRAPVLEFRRERPHRTADEELQHPPDARHARTHHRTQVAPTADGENDQHEKLSARPRRRVDDHAGAVRQRPHGTDGAEGDRRLAQAQPRKDARPLGRDDLRLERHAQHGQAGGEGGPREGRARLRMNRDRRADPNAPEQTREEQSDSGERGREPQGVRKDVRRRPRAAASVRLAQVLAERLAERPAEERAEERDRRDGGIGSEALRPQRRQHKPRRDEIRREGQPVPHVQPHRIPHLRPPP